ncbi:MAG TPA: hypothetical protein VIP98_20550 [Microlunatus sp.]
MIVLDIDPNVVKPGWTPLIITILLAAAIALLMISMRRQMRKVTVPYRDELRGEGESQGEDDAPTADSDPAREADGDTTDSAEPADHDDRHPIGNSG